VADEVGVEAESESIDVSANIETGG